MTDHEVEVTLTPERIKLYERAMLIGLPSIVVSMYGDRIQKLIDDEREACAKMVGDFAKKWWSIHCASNKHMETTRKAHDDFCSLQVAIRARGQE